MIVSYPTTSKQRFIDNKVANNERPGVGRYHSFNGSLESSECRRNALHRSRRNSVSFSSVVDSKEVPSATDLPRNELWYNSNDLEEISMDVRNTVAMMSSETLDDFEDVGFCQRGLEHLTDDEALKSQERKQSCVDAVLDKQIDNWSEGIYRPEDLAQECRSHSLRSLSDAIQRAQNDELEAKQVISCIAVE